MLDLSGRLIVIIGGGQVAARKAAGLLAASATRIKVVAPEITDTMPDGVERVLEKYAPSHLTGAHLVFAATNLPAVNAAVVRDAHELGLLVNRSENADEDPGDFSTPALFREQDLIVTISAAGHPTLAAAIRDDLKAHIDRRWIKMLEAMQSLRPKAQSEIANEQTRRAVLRDMATSDALQILQADGVDALWAWLLNRHLKNA
jgi:precorrin-2 dehydrogenase/sirohydrochlorin ferrochelatase